MFRTVAMTLLALGAGAAGTAFAAEQQAGEPKADVKSATASASMQQATQRAVQVLAAQLKIGEGDIVVMQAEPRTWPDSSMGCGKPGTLAMQVITEGHAVSLSAQGKQYRVHVSGTHAVVCDKPLLMRKELRRPASARGLDVAIEQAREDLARRLRTEASQVRLVRTQPQLWPDNGLGCPRADEPIVAGPVAGYRLSLEHGSRIYTYHTDLTQVRPCPAIEDR
jgi:hypothetical protein